MSNYVLDGTVSSRPFTYDFKGRRGNERKKRSSRWYYFTRNFAPGQQVGLLTTDTGATATGTASLPYVTNSNFFAGRRVVFNSDSSDTTEVYCYTNKLQGNFQATEQYTDFTNLFNEFQVLGLYLQWHPHPSGEEEGSSTSMYRGEIWFMPDTITPGSGVTDGMDFSSLERNSRKKVFPIHRPFDIHIKPYIYNEYRDCNGTTYYSPTAFNPVLKALTNFDQTTVSFQLGLIAFVIRNSDGDFATASGISPGYFTAKLTFRCREVV